MADSKSFIFSSTSETTRFNPGSFKHNSYRSPRAKRHLRCKSAIFSTTISTTPVPATSTVSTPSTASSSNNNNGSSTTNGSVFNFGYATSSETKVEINQNKETEEANQEPVSTSLLPLTMISRILNGIPQSPHFYQLRNYSELVRKNLISSWDCTFEGTVTQLHCLQAVDFWVKASELWKTMGELQSLGYNVILLRRRLVELSDVMMELKISQIEIKGLKIKAEHHRMEKSRIESVILNLQETAKREQDSMERVLVEVAKMDSELPKFDGVFAKLALEPL